MAARHLFLFDVDGVLVEAAGYRRALQDTIAHFAGALGLAGDLAPTAAEIHAIEAHGITSEWDSGPLCVGYLLVERLRQTPDLVPPPAWEAALALLGAQPPVAIDRPAYGAWRLWEGEWRLAAGAPALAVQPMAVRIRAFLDARAASLPPAQQAPVAALLDALLAGAYTYARAPVMRHFQHRVIGSERIAATYCVAPDFASPSYLQLYDRAALAADMRAGLLDAIAGERVRAAIYTARPTLPPAGVAPAYGYSPEGELARALVGLETLPLIGFGRIQWLAAQVGQHPGRLVKPSPVQALAAIGAAWSRDEAAALHAAWAWSASAELQSPLRELDGVTVHVFEDSAGGIRAVAQAVASLRDAGRAVACRPYGIASPGSPKAAALARTDARLFPDIDAALAEADSGIGG